MEEEQVWLAPDEDPVGHDFASTRRYKSDIALLNYLLQDLRVLVRRAARGETPLLRPQQIVTWEVHGLQRRTVVCDPNRLRAPAPVHIVGFFGDRRTQADKRPIDQSEFDLIAEFCNYPGILSYSSTELVDDYWANLVVHAEPTDREAWRESEIHKRAVADVAPIAYHNVRIHNGWIRGEGVMGLRTVWLQSTKYWDYDVDPVWHAFRDLPGGESVHLIGPTEGTSL